MSCEKCKGIGYVIQEHKFCSICDGKKCYSCRESGYIVPPTKECEECYGLGKKIKKEEIIRLTKNNLI